MNYFSTVCCRISFIRLLLLLLIIASFSACQKDTFTTSPNAQLRTDEDSLKFDTVFTGVGSVTKSFIITNDNDQKLLLSKVQLMGGVTSNFTININGIAAAQADNITIAANDSIYVFVTVNARPNNAALPFVLQDSVLIAFNGNSRFVQLQAFGQNAHFLRNKVLTGANTWRNDLPYVLLGGLRIDTSASLTIAAGCKIYAHADAPIVVDGTLLINGTKALPVQFTGDRLDGDYAQLPASWPGIYFRENSTNNVLQNAVIKNANQALVVTNPSLNGHPKLTLHQCSIDNAYDAGLLAINSSVQADNCLIANSGANVSLLNGGDYNLTHCTVAGFTTNYNNHKKPVLTVSNGADSGASSVLHAVFTNCIFWGESGIVDNEVSVNKQGSAAFHVAFDHCLYKSKDEILNSSFLSCLKNTAPLFDSIDVNKGIYNFHTSSPLAPGLDKGAVVAGFAKDLDDNNRMVKVPDMGCYEQQ